MRVVTDKIFHLDGDSTKSHGGLSEKSVETLAEAKDRASLIYIHIPFCVDLCPYCSFNRIRLEEPLAKAYFESIEKELKLYYELGFRFTSAYIGGGTPTVLPPLLIKTIETLQKLWAVDQISVETNPNHLDDSTVSALVESGISRLSVGVQTFQDRLLSQLKRLTTYGSGQEIRNRLNSLHGRFKTLNVDMIFNLPSQTLSDLSKDLYVIADLETNQTTFYPFMRPHPRVRSHEYGKEHSYYRLISEQLRETYERSSAWCFSRGSELVDEYIIEQTNFACAGSGSFGFLNGTLYANTFSIPSYVQLLDNNHLPIILYLPFSLRWRLKYELLMRLFRGWIDLTELTDRHGPHALTLLRPQLTLLRLTKSVTTNGTVLHLTDRGYYYLLVLTREFFIGVNNLRTSCTSAMVPR